jgi:uncharacterized protein YndB with AHSA1/START domain
MMSEEQNTPKEDIVITRTIPAPVELVWRAWTDPEYVVRWWGPQYFTAPLAEVDLREGGRFLFAMQAPEEQGGQRHYNTGEYLKVEPHKLLEFTMQLADADGNPVDPASVGMPPDFPGLIRTRIEFKALRPDLTRMTITEYDWTPGQMMVYSYAGMHQSLDKMELDLFA